MRTFWRSAIAALIGATLVGCPAPVDGGTGFGGGGGGGGPADTTPPVFTVAPTATPSATTVVVTATINEAGKIYVVAMADNATAPTATEVKNGTGAVASASNTNVPANQSVQITITGLTHSTAYDIYAVAEDNVGNLGAVSTKIDVTTTTPDTTPPVFTPGSHIIGKTQFTIVGTTDEAAQWWALLVADSAPAPTVAQVKDPSTYTGEIDAKNTNTFSTSVSILFDTGLTAGTPYDVYLVFADLEGNETSPIKVDISTQAVIARILSFGPVFSAPAPYWADGGAGWIDIQVLDAAAFNALSDWAVVSATFNTPRVTYMTKANVPITWTIANNDIIRIHFNKSGVAWSGTTDVNKSDNHAAYWDYKTTTTSVPSDFYGYIYLANSSTIDGTEGVLDLLTYANTAAGNQSYWVENKSPPAANDQNLTFLQNNVPTHWPQSTRGGAYQWGGANTGYLRLKNTVTLDGEGPSDWESYAPPALVLSNPTLSPSSLLSGYSGTPTITISVTASVFGGATITGITTDTSAISTTSSVTLTGPATGGTWTGTVDVQNGLGVGSYTVTLNASGTLSTSATANVNFAINPGPVLAFTGADFESGVNGSGGNMITPTTNNTDPSPEGGSYLVLSGTTGGSNGDIYLSTPNMGSASGYTKITFWIKGTATKGLVVRIGNSGSDYFNVNDDNLAGPLNVTGSPIYAGKTVNAPSWTKVTLNLGSIDTAGKKFIFRGGSSANYNLLIDHILFE